MEKMAYHDIGITYGRNRIGFIVEKKGKSVMEWGSISFMGPVGMKGIEGSLYWKYYCKVLKDGSF